MQERWRHSCPPAHTVIKIILHILLNINVTLVLLLGVRMVIAMGQVESHNAAEALMQFANPVANAPLTKLSEVINFYLLRRTNF